MVLAIHRTVKRERRREGARKTFPGINLKNKPEINSSFRRKDWMDLSTFSPRLFSVLWVWRRTLPGLLPLTSGGEEE